MEDVYVKGDTSQEANLGNVKLGLQAVRIKKGEKVVGVNTENRTDQNFPRPNLVLNWRPALHYH